MPLEVQTETMVEKVQNQQEQKPYEKVKMPIFKPEDKVIMGQVFQSTEESKALDYQIEEESIRATEGQVLEPEESKGMVSPMSQNTEPILDTFII